MRAGLISRHIGRSDPEPATNVLRRIDMRPIRPLAAFAAPSMITMLLMVGGCATSGCTPLAGGRCAGPEPIPLYTWPGTPRTPLYAGPAVSPDGRTIIVIVPCGGRLAVHESQVEVLITWIASALGAGVMSCAEVTLTVHLRQPLGSRRLVDGVTGARLHPPVCRSDNGLFPYICT
jgi:hypothetical protein